MVRGLLFFVVFMVSPRALAGVADCATLGDHDVRMMCFALQTGNSSYCSFIRDGDKRTQCRILAGK
jgi:hypothetical protein